MFRAIQHSIKYSNTRTCYRIFKSRAQVFLLKKFLASCSKLQVSDLNWDSLYERKDKMGLKDRGKQNPTSLSQSKGDFTQLENTQNNYQPYSASFSLNLTVSFCFHRSLSPSPHCDCFCKVSAYFKLLPYDCES